MYNVLVPVNNGEEYVVGGLEDSKYYMVIDLDTMSMRRVDNIVKLGGDLEDFIEDNDLVAIICSGISRNNRLIVEGMGVKVVITPRLKLRELIENLCG